MAPTRECVSCMGDDSDGETVLYDTECGNRHFMCADCLHTLFELAAKDEKHYPPRCCNDETSVLLISKFEEVLPFEVAWDFQAKEAGEYSINPKYRIYCANARCAAFLHPKIHRKHPVTSGSPSSSGAESSTSAGESSAESVTTASETIYYATCDICSSVTCTSCKVLIEKDISNHQCQEVSNDEKQFKLIVEEKGYQECNNCGSTVELTEACNHISCNCGAEFCYACGKEWEGLHGCVHYGPNAFDPEGYNQDGFHKETGLNRDGRTRQEQINHDRGVDGDNDSDDERDDGPRIPFPPELQQAIDNGIIPFEEAFEQWQISMIETGQVVDINQFLQQPNNGAGGHDDDDGEDERPDSDVDEDEDEDEDEGADAIDNDDEEIEEHDAAEGYTGSEHDDEENLEEEDLEIRAEDPVASTWIAFTQASGSMENDDSHGLRPPSQHDSDFGDTNAVEEAPGLDDLQLAATITQSMSAPPNDDADATNDTYPLVDLLFRESTTVKGDVQQELPHQDSITVESVDHYSLPMPYTPEEEL